MDPRFDKQAQEWDDNPGRVKLASDVADAMAAALPLRPDATLVDYGAGTGLVSLKLAPLVGRVTAVDASEGMVRVLGDKIRAAGLEDRIQALRISDDGADVPALNADFLVSSMVLHHIPDTAGAVRRFFGLLRPGGRAAVADLEPDHGLFHADNNGVEHFGFSREQVAETFRAAGFTDIRITEAARMTKPGADGVVRDFPVFLLTARKP